MKKLLAFLDEVYPLLLWIALLISVSQNEALFSITIAMLIINDNIEKIRKEDK